MQLSIRKKAIGICLALACALAPAMLTSCGGGGGGTGSSSGETSGAAFNPPSTIPDSRFNINSLVGTAAAGIDVTSVDEGFVGAVGLSDSRLKLQVTKDGTSYNYDMPNDGTPMIAPLNMGNGAYTFAIMQNTTENRYIELISASANANMASEFDPYIRPNIFCNYTPSSPVVTKAKELTANAENEADALQAIYSWIVDNVTYDKAKAAELAGKSSYIPDPDATLSSQTGICFDYASLAAAMLRSQGIPTKVITGYVSPDGIYHAWNEVWIDGSWKTVAFTVNPKTWTRIDVTFAAGGDESTVGNGDKYEDRYVY